MKLGFTMHMWISFGLMLLAVVFMLSPIIGTNGHWASSITEYRVVGSELNTPVVPAERATDAIVPDLSGTPSHNPFNARSNGGPPSVRIPPPPIPHLDYPALPVMPAAFH
jgi:hypothetical protein